MAKNEILSEISIVHKVELSIEAFTRSLKIEVLKFKFIRFLFNYRRFEF